MVPTTAAAAVLLLLLLLQTATKEAESALDARWQVYVATSAQLPAEAVADTTGEARCTAPLSTVYVTAYFQQ